MPGDALEYIYDKAEPNKEAQRWGAQVFVNRFGMPLKLAQLLYHALAGVIVLWGMKAVGVAQKYAVIVLFAIVAAMSVGSFTGDVSTLTTNMSRGTTCWRSTAWSSLLPVFRRKTGNNNENASGNNA